MENKIYIGIDPGQSGGICIMQYNIGDNSWQMSAYKMPDTEHDTNDILGHFDHRSVKAMIEKVGAMPGQGVSSMFKFGKNYGFLRGLLIANLISFTEVPPRTWQKGLGVKPRGKTESKTQFKNRLKGMAQQLYPGEKITLATSDAILIAEYLWKTDKQR